MPKFKLLLHLDSGERVDKGDWDSLEQAIEQGRLWLETCLDFARFSVCRSTGAGWPRVYAEERPRPFTPPRRERLSALAGRVA